MLKAFIITEGGGPAGYGHISRCLALYQAFKKKGIRVKMIINSMNGITLPDIELIDFRLLDWIKRENAIFEIIDNADIAVIDSYLAKRDFYERISMNVKLPVYIDDFRRIDYPAGVVINSAVGIDESFYKWQKDVKYLLGIKYHTLREEFYGNEIKKIKEYAESVMITMGGTDIRGLTARLVTMLNEDFPAINKKVIITNDFVNVKGLEDFRDDKTDLVYSPGAEQVKQIMLGSDIAISSGGVTLYELAKIGVPTICIKAADNQSHIINGFIKNGFIEYAGSWDDEDLLLSVKGKLLDLMNHDARMKKFETGRALDFSDDSCKVADILLGIYNQSLLP